MSWSSQKKTKNKNKNKKNDGIFCTVYFVRRYFFNICFISIYRALNTLSEYKYFYISKNITLYTFLSPKAFSVTLLHRTKTHFIFSIFMPRLRSIYVVSMWFIFHFQPDFYHNQSCNRIKTVFHIFQNSSLSFLDHNVDEQSQ